jgi:hypothetical protein
MSLGECATAAEANDCVRWAREFWQAVQPHSNGTVYVNYPGQDDEGPEPDQVRLWSREIPTAGCPQEQIRSDESLPPQIRI